MSGKAIQRGAQLRSIAAALFLVAGALVGNPAISAAAEPDASKDQTLLYAQDQEVTRGEAERRMALMTVAGDAQDAFEAALGPRYGGLYIEHKPVFRVVIMSINTGAQQAPGSLGL